MAQQVRIGTLLSGKRGEGKFFFHSLEDHALALSRTWHLSSGYPSSKRMGFHEYIGGKAPRGLEWDHADRDKLNACRGNLWLVTHSENMHNKNLLKSNKTGCAGVRRQNGQFRAVIKIEGKRFHIGLFNTLEEAIQARRDVEKVVMIKVYGNA